ncbi:MAG: hypothetical protein EOM53_01235 [Alphaproteobacteria bacterium]|nr:hypothetical protein [Alphaproteobacteria bacterium]
MQENIMTSPVEEMKKPEKATKPSHLKVKVMVALLTLANLAALFTGCENNPTSAELSSKTKENGITRELPPENQIAPEDVIEEPSMKAIEGVSKAEDAFRFHVQNAYYNIYLEEKEKLENGPMTEKGDEYAGAAGQSWSYIYTAFENRGVSGAELDELILATGINELPLQETMPKVLALWQDLDMDSRENTNVIGVEKTDSEYTAYEMNKALTQSDGR